MKRKTYLCSFPHLMLFAFLLLAGLIISCKKSSDPMTGDPNSDLKGMTIEEIPGSDISYAKQVSAAGVLEIEGFVLNNKKTGQWTQYDDKGDILLINSYVDGLLEGPALRMTYRNQVDLKSTYHKGVLEGPWVSYKFGKIVETRNYKDGKLEGSVILYDDRTFEKKQETEFKNGLQDGFLRHYDAAGNVTLEYEYKNGEKISGGMTNK